MAAIIPPKPEYNRFEIPERFRKDEQFESFVLHHLFPPELYTLIDHASGNLQNAGRSRKQTMQPALLLRDNSNGLEFYAACKYRYGLIANSFRFSMSPQIGRYKTYSERSFFLVLGLGGSANAPTEVFLANFKDCPHEHLLKRHLVGKAIPTHIPVHPESLWKQETRHDFLSKQIA